VADPMSLAKEAYTAFGRGDMPALLATMADDVEWTVPDSPGTPLGGSYHGKQAVAEWFQRLGQELEFHKFEPMEWIASGDKVVVLIQNEFTVRRTGKRVADEACHVHTVRDGKLVRFRQYADTLKFVQAYQG
jgi:ketosteroid isomerase-like protein